MRKIILCSMQTTALAMVLATTSCNTETQKSKQPMEGASTANPSLSLESKGDLCGQILTLNELGDLKDNMRPLSLTLQMTICGKLDAGKDWHALGMTMRSPEVYLKKSADPYEATSANQAQLYSDAKDDVYAIKGVRRVHVGHLTSEMRSYPVTLESGVKIELIVKDHPYQIGDAKNTPDSDKHLFVTSDE